MKVNWWIVALTVIIGLCIISTIIWYRLHVTQPPLVTTKIENIDKQFKTGDLLVVNYRSKHGRLIRVTTGAFWSHIGLVIVLNNEIFIIEITDYDEKYKGLCMIPLNDWLDINSGRYCGYCPINKNIESNQIKELLDRYSDVTLDMDLFNWAQTLSWKDNRYLEKESYFCSEFIAMILQELRLLSLEKDPACYSPQKLLGLKDYGKTRVFYLD